MAVVNSTVAARPAEAIERSAPLQEQHKAGELVRIQSLDAWRGMAAVIVFLCHAAASTATFAHHQNFICITLRKLAAFGNFGLYYLFVLSGCLVTRILLQSKGHPHWIRTYYLRRSLRIFPIYYAFLFVCTILAPAIFGLAAKKFLGIQEGLGWLWIYGTNVVQTINHNWYYGRLSHLWSLSVEEHFYMLWPFVVAMLSTRGFVIVCTLLAIVSSAYRFYLGYVADDYFATRVFTLCNMDCIAAGALLAVMIYKQKPETCIKLAKVLLTASAVLFPLYAVIAYNSQTVSGAFGPTIAGLASSGLVLLASVRTNMVLPVAHNFFRMVGKYSYGIYLFHYPIIHWVAKDLIPRTWTPVAEFFAISLVSWAVVVPLATLSFKYFETPFLNLKEKLH